MENQYLTD